MEHLLEIFKMSHYLSFDVESVGLFGPPFAVGYVVVTEKGEEVGNGLLGWDYHNNLDELVESSASRWSTALGDQLWVEENVIPALPKGWANCKTQGDLYQSFYMAWQSYKASLPDLLLVTDCPFPVEANFLLEMLKHVNRRTLFDSPYPLIDVASILLAAGQNPLATTKRRDGELPAHNPLNDARQSARQLVEALRVLDFTYSW